MPRHSSDLIWDKRKGRNGNNEKVKTLQKSGQTSCERGVCEDRTYVQILWLQSECSLRDWRMCALAASEIYSFMLNNVLFVATIWPVGKHQRNSESSRSSGSSKQWKQCTQREKDVSVCVQEEEAKRGERDTEINIQRKRGKEQPPSFTGRLGCSSRELEEVFCVSVNACMCVVEGLVLA